MTSPLSAVAATQTAASPDRSSMLRDAAEKLEASFIAEMLKSAGFGKARDSFGGGAGESQFGSILVRAQAEQMAKAGGIGLAETIFNALKEAENEQGHGDSTG